MALTTLLNQPALRGHKSNGLCRASSVDVIKINSIMDIAIDFDIFLFSSENILSKNGMVLPAGAVTVPQLRQMGKKLALFSVHPDQRKKHLINHVNHLGLSFSRNEVMLLEDLQNLEECFPLYPPHRILMVCSDVIEEVPLGREHGVTTLLITEESDNRSSELGIWSHYVSNTV